MIGDASTSVRNLAVMTTYRPNGKNIDA